MSMNKNRAVILIIIYLFSLLAVELFFGYSLLFNSLFPTNHYNLLFECILLGGIGGAMYCLRGVYLNFCVRKNWDNEWSVWYVLRPVVSLICGGVSYLFLKAGLLVLEAKNEADATNLGFYAFAFIAGLNVDKFIAKIEDIAKSTWGIDKSRSSDNGSNSGS